MNEQSPSSLQSLPVEDFPAHAGDFPEIRFPHGLRSGYDGPHRVTTPGTGELPCGRCFFLSNKSGACKVLFPGRGQDAAFRKIPETDPNMLSIFCLSV